MSKTQIHTIALFFIIFVLSSFSLKLDQHHQQSPVQNHFNQNSLSTNASQTECSRDFCIRKFGLLDNPLDPHCQQNAQCWRKWFGMPDCKDDDIKCWKNQVGYLETCQDNDYDCWLKAYGYPNCQDDVQCLKNYLNFTCSENDLECWKGKSLMPKCKWNQWDCWYQNQHMQPICRQKKGFKCVQFYFGKPCKEDDQQCWRQILLLPTKQCQQNVDCFKKFYLLPTCKDNDIQCWKKLYYGPNCKKGDMDCLKKFLWIPDCTNQKDQVKCYKKWLDYPECSRDDGKCWQKYNSQLENSMFWGMSVTMFKHNMKNNHNLERNHNKRISFGQMMKHKRQSLSRSHKLDR